MKTDKPFWWQTHRGGVSCIIENAARYASEVDAWHLVTGLVQRMPYAEREACIAARRVALAIGGIPETTVFFRVVRWHPQSITLTLEYEFTAVAQPQYEFRYL